nr:MAG TPA: hypothetical protein [Bacteriophage sp.]
MAISQLYHMLLQLVLIYSNHLHLRNLIIYH